MKSINLNNCKTPSDYNDLLVKLDMRVGECFAVLGQDHELHYMWRIVEKYEGANFGLNPSQGDVYKLDIVIVYSHGCTIYENEFIDAEDIYEAKDVYTYIVQVEQKWFDKICNSIALLSSQLNAYQVELNKRIVD